MQESMLKSHPRLQSGTKTDLRTYRTTATDGFHFTCSTDEDLYYYINTENPLTGLQKFHQILN